MLLMYLTIWRLSLDSQFECNPEKQSGMQIYVALRLIKEDLWTSNVMFFK